MLWGLVLIVAMLRLYVMLRLGLQLRLLMCVLMVRRPTPRVSYGWTMDTQ